MCLIREDGGIYSEYLCFVSYSRLVICMYVYIYMYSDIHRLKTNNIFTDLTLYQIHTHLGDGHFPLDQNPESSMATTDDLLWRASFFYSDDCMKHILYTYMHIYIFILPQKSQDGAEKPECLAQIIFLTFEEWTSIGEARRFPGQKTSDLATSDGCTARFLVFYTVDGVPRNPAWRENQLR